MDASVLTELLSGTDLSRPLRQSIDENTAQAYTTYYGLTEAEYILCREIGRARAREKIENLVLSRAIETVEGERVYHQAAETKCDRAIALGDCYTLALAANIKGKAVFARLEQDLSQEIRKKPFAVELFFLEEPNRRKN